MDSSFYKGWWPRLIRDPPEGGVTASLLLSGFTGAKLPKGQSPAPLKSGKASLSFLPLKPLGEALRGALLP